MLNELCRDACELGVLVSKVIRTLMLMRRSLVGNSLWPLYFASWYISSSSPETSGKTFLSSLSRHTAQLVPVLATALGMRPQPAISETIVRTICDHLYPGVSMYPSTTLRTARSEGLWRMIGREARQSLRGAFALAPRFFQAKSPPDSSALLEHGLTLSLKC